MKMKRSMLSTSLCPADDEDAEDRPANGGDGDEDEEDGDGTSRPAAGNTEGESVHMTKHEIREARGEYMYT